MWFGMYWGEVGIDGKPKSGRETVGNEGPVLARILVPDAGDGLVGVASVQSGRVTSERPAIAGE